MTQLWISSYASNNLKKEGLQPKKNPNPYRAKPYNGHADGQGYSNQSPGGFLPFDTLKKLGQHSHGLAMSPDNIIFEVDDMDEVFSFWTIAITDQPVPPRPAWGVWGEGKKKAVISIFIGFPEWNNIDELERETLGEFVDRQFEEDLQKMFLL